MSEKTPSTVSRSELSVSLSWPHMPRLILALSQTPVCQVNTVPSVITSERDTKEDLNVSQSISRDPRSVVLHDLIPKPCLRNIHIYPLCAGPKKSAFNSVSDVFILMLPNTKTFKLKKPSVPFFPTKDAHLFAD